MLIKFRRPLLQLVAALAVAAILPIAQAQDFPNRPVKLVVPFGTGGSTDIVARLLAQQLTKQLGQQVIVENKPGASAIIGSTFVMRSPPDGYTLLVTTINFGANPALFREKLPFDPLKDFTMISQMVNVPTVLSVHPTVKARTAAELIGLARSKPGELNFGSAGYGTINHLAGELLKSMDNLNIVHVPYKSGGEVVKALVGGEITMLFATVPSVLAFVKSGHVIPLAASGSKLIEHIPQVPPLGTVVPGFSVNDWQALVGPKNIPRELVERLNKEVVAAFNDPALRKRLAELGAEPATGTPQDLEAHVKSEMAKWMKVSETTGMRVKE